jgi:uncharacterized protein DUF4383
MAAATGNVDTGRRGMTWPQTLALVFGVVYLVIGIIGYFITGFGNFFGNDNTVPPTHMDTLLGFMINPLHNLVHIVIGLAGIALARTLAHARTYGWLLTVGYGAAFVYGLFAVDKSWDFLNLNWADNVLHLVTAVVGLVIALGPVRRAVSHAGTRTA